QLGLERLLKRTAVGETGQLVRHSLTLHDAVQTGVVEGDCCLRGERVREGHGALVEPARRWKEHERDLLVCDLGAGELESQRFTRVLERALARHLLAGADSE